MNPTMNQHDTDFPDPEEVDDFQIKSVDGKEYEKLESYMQDEYRAWAEDFVFDQSERRQHAVTQLEENVYAVDFWFGPTNVIIELNA